jgi:2,3-bisphosphoglycerate-dependent phosphoglycerate mutase
MTPYDHFGETGESRMELYLRAGKAIQDLVDRGPGCYLVVSHGGILNMALYSILGIPLHADSQGPRFIFGNTGFCRLTYNPGLHSWRMWELDNRGNGLA